MNYFILFFAFAILSALTGCQPHNDPPPAIRFNQVPVPHPNILDDEDWLFAPSTDSVQQHTAGSINNCLELITVDFEPHPFGNVVQTVPYHVEKQPMDNAFVCVKVALHQIPWVIWLYSENVLFAEQAFVSFDDYSGDFDRYVSPNQQICEVHLWDTLQAHQYLYTYGQLIAEVEIECYFP